MNLLNQPHQKTNTHKKKNQTFILSNEHLFLYIILFVSALNSVMNINHTDQTLYSENNLIKIQLMAIYIDLLSYINPSK